MQDVDTNVEGERATLLHAAANARSAAMLTGTHGVVAPPLDRAAIRLPAPRDLLDDGAEWEAREGESVEAALLRARADALSALAGLPAGISENGAGVAEHAVAALRAYLELAGVELDEGRTEVARASAERASRALDHAPAAHALLRTLSAGRDAAAIDAQLGHVEHLTAHVSDVLVRADFLAEQGRLLEAKGGASVESAAAYAAALALVPDHAGALFGLEAALDSTGRWSELAALLGRLAGLAGNPTAAAWLHVERALILDRRLGDSGAARSALERALELAPGLGPVRQACVDHAVVHRDDARLGALLESEAMLEKDAARAACLELDGALAHLRAGDAARATKSLERAHGRGRTSKVVDARIANELSHVLSKSGRSADVLRVRKAALGIASDPRAELLALRGVATAAEQAGELSDAVLAMERARVLDGGDATLLEELDRLLVAAGRHEARAVLWMREAALADETSAKTRALLNAADASAAAGRDGDAARHRETAWITDPSAPGVFDALIERLAAPAARENVAARVALYERAAERAGDVGKRLHYLEKIAWLWDDVAGDPALAAQAYEDVLAVDPKRRSAIAGLGSAAARARDPRKLARALLAEAAVAEDATVRGEIRLRAAETLAEMEPERALALAEDLSKPKRAPVATRARALVTRLHAAAGRWELVVRSLAARAASEKRSKEKLALVLAEAAVFAQRLDAPDRALVALESAREIVPGEPAVAAAIVSALEAQGDEEALRAKLEELAEDALDAETRASHLVRAAELAERRAGGEEDAVRLYVRARAALPTERLVAERLHRLGARADVPAEYVSALPLAVRSLDTGRSNEHASAQALLSDVPSDFATLRVAERLARRGRSAPQLANALALTAEATVGILAHRALAGLASLVAWTLPASADLAPWDRLVALGSRDAVVLDELVARARPLLLAGDRPALDLAIEATRRRLEGAADDSERIALLVALARMHERASDFREASTACRRALVIDPTSTGAAVLLARVSEGAGDRPAAIAAAVALAAITRSARARALLLRDAADLSSAEGEPKRAAELLERALESDPESVLIAARLAQVQAKEGAWADLGRALRRGLHAARSRDAVVPMAAELADVAKNRLNDPLLAIEALERSREIAPQHVPALFLLAELYIGRRMWDEALRALADVVACTTENDEKLTALVGRASILGRVLERPAEAEQELRAALLIDPHEPRALRGLLALPSPLEPAERAELLSRLVVAEVRPAARLSALLELAKVRRLLGDAGGAEAALVEGAALAPDAVMLERLRESAGGDVETAARVIGRALARARERGAAPGAVWFATLGDLELGLGRTDDAIEHFEEALRLEPLREMARLALARALSRKGRHETAAAALSPLLDVGGAGSAGVVDVSFVRQLDEAFTGAGRTQQALVAHELRAIAGDLDEKTTAALTARRPMYVTNGEALSGTVLRSFVMPGKLGKNVLWDVAAVAATMSGKLARVGLAEQGATSRDRVKPKAVHPLRPLFDRLARAFELFDVELAVSEHVAAPVVACEDVTWIVVPASLAEWDEPTAIAALTRPFARVALGVPWFGSMPPEETLAMLVAVARQVVPSFGAMPRERVDPLVTEYELRARRAIDRKRRKSLEDLEGELTQAAPLSVDAFSEAVLRTEARAAFLMSGDLRASLEAVGTTEAGLVDALRSPGQAALSAVLSRVVSRDLVAFALSADATSIRRSLGTLWS